LWPSDAVREQLASLTHHFHRQFGGRPMAPDSLHITLAFLGETPNARLFDLQTLGQSITTPSFALTLNRAGCWQKGIFWLGPTEAPPALLSLASALHQGLKVADIFFDDSKPFKPHLTLMRKAEAPRNWQDAITPIEFSVSDFALVRSASASSGVQYEDVARFPLVTA